MKFDNILFPNIVFFMAVTFLEKHNQFYIFACWKKRGFFDVFASF